MNADRIMYPSLGLVVAADSLAKRDVFKTPDPFAIVTVDGEQTKTTAAIKVSQISLTPPGFRTGRTRPPNRPQLLTGPHPRHFHSLVRSCLVMIRKLSTLVRRAATDWIPTGGDPVWEGS